MELSDKKEATTSKRELDRIEKELAELQEQIMPFFCPLAVERKKELDQVKDLSCQIDSWQSELEQAQRKGDLEAQPRIRYSDMCELEKKLAHAESTPAAEKGNAMVKEKSTAK